jgi:hypothetical protein
VASTVGNGYTVEEQITGKADVGGLQCDIFQCRNFGGTFSLRSTFQDLDDLKTLQELNIPVQSQVLLSPNKWYVLDSNQLTPVFTGSNSLQCCNSRQGLDSKGILQTNYLTIHYTQSRVCSFTVS